MAESLIFIGQKTGLTYNEINVLVYYLLMPLSWTIMVDLRLGLPITTIPFLCVWLGIAIAKRKRFSLWCDGVFMKSVDFLNWFNRWGGNYVLNSVIICVVLPLIIYGLLIWLIVS